MFDDIEMDLSETQAHIDFLDWRDAQLEAICLQLEDAYPLLLAQLSKRIDQATHLDLVRSSLRLQKDIGAIVRAWSKEQAHLALQRTKAAFEEFTLDANLDQNLRDQLRAALPALAGTGLAALSLAAIPTVISFATVTSSTLAIFTTTAVSWPLFVLGTAGLAVTAFVSRGLIDRGVAGLRVTLHRRAQTLAASTVFGLGAQPGQRNVLEDIQALALKAAANSFGEL